MPEPIFSAEDRIDGQPPSSDAAARVAALEAENEQLKKDLFKAKAQDPPPNAPPAPPAPPTGKEFWTDPINTSQKVARETFMQLAQPMQAALINAARMACKEAHPDFDQFKETMQTLLDKMDRWLWTDPVTWETCYTHARGLDFEKGVAAAEARARRPIGEPPTPPGTPPPTPRTLGDIEMQVCAGLEISPETYLKHEERMRKNEWPLTMSNTRRR